MPDTELNSIQRKKLRILTLKERSRLLEKGSPKKRSKETGGKEEPQRNSGGRKPGDNSEDDKKAGGDPPMDDEKDGGMAGGTGGGGDEEDDKKIPEEPVDEEKGEEEDEGEEKKASNSRTGNAVGNPRWLTSISRARAMGDDMLFSSALQRARPLSAFSLRQRTMNSWHLRSP